jgi:hypothetical protein
MRGAKTAGGGYSWGSWPLLPSFLTPSPLTGSPADSASEKLASLPEAG